MSPCSGISYRSLQILADEQARDLFVDRDLLQELASIDGVIDGVDDGCVSPAEAIRAFGAKSSAQLKRLSIRTVKLEGYLQWKLQAEADLAEQSPLTQTLVAESPDSPFHSVAATRFDMVASIMRVAVEGAYARDLSRANGSSKHMIDILSIPRKLAFWQDSNSTVDLWEAWAEANRVKRWAAVEKFLEALAPLAQRGVASEEEAREAIDAAMGSVEIWTAKDQGDSCHDTIGRGAPGHPCAPDFLRSEIPLDLIVKLLATPAGDMKGLESTLLDLARAFEGSWVNGQQNWIAATFIALELRNAKGFIHETSYAEAGEILHRIQGDPGAYVFASAILPIFWSPSSLHASQRVTLAEDTLLFFATIIGGGKAANQGIEWTQQALGRASTNLVERNPRLHRFLVATSEANPRKIELVKQAVETALEKVPSGSLALLPEKQLRFFARSDPAYFKALAKRGVVVSKELLDEADEVMRIRAATTLGPRARGIARGLGWFGDKSYLAWHHTFGALGRGAKTGLLYGWVVGKGAYDYAASLPRLGRLVSGAAGVTKEAIIILGSPIKVNWKGGVVVWWGMQAYGEPFIRPLSATDPDAPMLRAIGDESRGLQETIREVFEEMRMNDIDPLERVIIRELDDRANEAGGIRGDLLDRLIADPVLAEIGFSYIDRQGMMADVTADQGKKHVERYTAKIPPHPPFIKGGRGGFGVHFSSRPFIESAFGMHDDPFRQTFEATQLLDDADDTFFALILEAQGKKYLIIVSGEMADAVGEIGV